MTIAITGATGHLGRLVVDKLKNRVPAESIVALARNPANAADLGVPVRAFDYDLPETLEPALGGVKTLLLISGSEVGQRVPQHRAVIDAARNAGVSRIAYTSLLRADTSPMLLAEEHLATERYLTASGVAYTLLRNSWYTENYAGALLGALRTGEFHGDSGNGCIAAAAREDYAEAAAIVLTGEGHENRTYELAGDEPFTLAELAAAFSEQIGKEIRYTDVPEAEYRAALEGMGIPALMARILADSGARIADGALYDDSHQLAALLGRPTTPIAVTLAALIEKAG